MEGLGILNLGLLVMKGLIKLVELWRWLVVGPTKGGCCEVKEPVLSMAAAAEVAVAMAVADIGSGWLWVPS